MASIEGSGMDLAFAMQTSSSQPMGPSKQQPQHYRSRRRVKSLATTAAFCGLLASVVPVTMAQSCISLAQSKACPAFNASSISTDKTLVGFFPFLSSVHDVSSFDSGLQNYIANGFTQERYQQLLGCSNVNLTHSADYYARYTTSVLCNAIIQNSITPCSLSGNATRPLCADSCAAYAQNEQDIVASSFCGTSGSNALSQIRADFTNCALPADSLTESCVEAYVNQPDNCGFYDNLSGLCSYCASSAPNSTDSCCVFSNTTTRCTGVSLPIMASSSLAPVTVTQTPTSSASTTTTSGFTRTPVAAASNGLSKGDIAGIVVGSVLGALLLLALLIVGCLCIKRRRDNSPATSVFNQPATNRRPQMAYNDGARDVAPIAPGARVARMAALEGSSSSNGGNRYTLGAYHKGMSDDEDDEETTPDRRLAPPPKRSGSLSSGSQLGVLTGTRTDTSPSSQNDYTTPESTGQSEQLDFFKDYYSQDEIHPGDLVSTLWAYEPRAADEFALERGDMIKVLGIWDDGWATGIRVRGQRAEDWRSDSKIQRDSGLSTGSSSMFPPPTTATTTDSRRDTEVKAFPLVCVCLPQYWRTTIEGDSTDSSGVASALADLR